MGSETLWHKNNTPEQEIFLNSSYNYFNSNASPLKKVQSIVRVFGTELWFSSDLINYYNNKIYLMLFFKSLTNDNAFDANQLSFMNEQDIEHYRAENFGQLNAGFTNTNNELIVTNVWFSYVVATITPYNSFSYDGYLLNLI